MVIDRIRKAFYTSPDEVSEEEYVELDIASQEPENEKKVKVKLFTLNQYDDVNGILNALREGYTIAIIDFKKLKQRDPIELKRAISKIKKTIAALEGSIAGHENLVIATPSFAKIYKEERQETKKSQESSNLETY